jgi:hypothetical protein
MISSMFSAKTSQGLGASAATAAVWAMTCEISMGTTVHPRACGEHSMVYVMVGFVLRISTFPVGLTGFNDTPIDE